MPGQISAKRSFMMMPSDACRAHGHLPSDCFGCPMCHRADSRTGCGARWEGKSEICAFRGLFLIWWEQELRRAAVPLGRCSHSLPQGPSSPERLRCVPSHDSNTVFPNSWIQQQMQPNSPD